MLITEPVQPVGNGAHEEAPFAEAKLLNEKIQVENSLPVFGRNVYSQTVNISTRRGDFEERGWREGQFSVKS